MTCFRQGQLLRAVSNWVLSTIVVRIFACCCDSYKGNPVLILQVFSLQVNEDLRAKLERAEKGALVAQSQAEKLSAAEQKVASHLSLPAHS